MFKDQIHKIPGGKINWASKTCGILEQLNSGYFIDANTGWVVGEDGIILKTTVDGIVSIIEEQSIYFNIPQTLKLLQNYPNPFNPTTTIEFDLPKTSEVTLKVFNILGEEVVTLVSDRLSAGYHSYDWDVRNLASGVYLYRLQAGDYVETRKMVLIK